MDFSLNDMQQMMQDSASRFIANEYDFETRRKLADSELGFSEHNWQTFAELKLTFTLRAKHRALKMCRTTHHLRE